MKRVIVLMLALLVTATTFAQTKFLLKIDCNVMGADVYVNDRLYSKTSANLAVDLPPGNWKIRVAMAGYADFSQTVAHKAPGTTLKVNLQQLAPAATLPAPTTIIPVFALTVTSNVNGADVYMGTKLFGKTPFTGNFGRGVFDLTVKAPGYSDFTQKISITGPTSVQATLQPLGYSLNVNSNVSGAEVIINNISAGRTPFVSTMSAGSYTLLVRAPGYMDFTQNIVVNGAVSINAMLQAALTPFTINTNVSGAEIWLNGTKYGTASSGNFMTSLPPGTYNLTVKLGGFLDFNMQVNLAAGFPQVINANLMPMMASWQFSIPANLLTPETRGNPWAQVRVYIDGAQQKNSSGQIQGGRHTVKLVSGALQIESIVDMEAGKTYTFEILGGISIK